MKRLSVISLTLLSLLTALLVGCGGSHDARVMAELDRADSLLRTNDTAAHSAALRQMLVLDTACALQADEALRARHALLLVQARYKCYATIPADSALIDTAYRYYADHHSSSADHERYTRSLIYKGAVAEELGHPQQAMQHYLEAESTADPTDYFNLGYANLRIAEIYQSEYTADTTDLIRYKKALPHFRKVDNIHYQAVCLTSIGGLYRTRNNDSAYHYIQNAIEFSKNNKLPYFYYKALDKLCGLYYFKGEYQRAKDIAVLIVTDTASSIYDNYDYLNFGITSYAKLGMTDSAEHYLKLLPPPQTQVDTMTWLNVNAEISRSKNDYAHYSVYALKCDSIASSIMLNSFQLQLKDSEEKYSNTILQLNNAKLKSKLLMLLVASLIFIIALLIILFRYINVRKQYKMSRIEMGMLHAEMKRNLLEIEMGKKKLIENEIEKCQLMDVIRSLERDNDEPFKLITAQQQVLKELTTKLECPEGNVPFLAAIFTKRARFNLKIGKLSNEFWTNLEYVVNTVYHGIITYTKQNFTSCSETDARFIALNCFGLSNEVIKLCLNFTNVKTVSSYKTHIVKKLTGTKQNLDDFINEFIESKV